MHKNLSLYLTLKTRKEKNKGRKGKERMKGKKSVKEDLNKSKRILLFTDQEKFNIVKMK